MADLDSALRQRANEIKTMESARAEDRQANAAAHLLALAARLEKLVDDEELKWFLGTYVLPLVEAERKAALDVLRLPSERDASAQRHDIANLLLHLLPDKAAEARASATAALRAAQK